MVEVKRATRVAERLKEELAWLVTKDVRDPRVQKVIVSRVEMPDDLKNARVFVRLLEGGDDQALVKDAITGLTRASGMLRRLAGTRMGLRYSPELTFVYDSSQDKTDRIEQLLHEVKNERKAE